MRARPPIHAEGHPRSSECVFGAPCRGMVTAAVRIALEYYSTGVVLLDPVAAGDPYDRGKVESTLALVLFLRVDLSNDTLS